VDSSGPATTVIASIKPSALSGLAAIFKDKLTIIGYFR
jgi:hypothetical protein